MSTTLSPPSTISGGAAPKNRRRRRSSSPPIVVAGTAENSAPSSASSFRNVSACNRCRQRKNRCDQRLPACISCEKAGVKCVGYDPITKREIPRSYVHYLESRMLYLQTLLQDNRIPFDPPDTIQFPLLLIGNDSAITSTPIGAFPPCSGNELKSPITPTPTMSEGSPNAHKIVSVRRKSTEEGGESDTSNETGLNKLVSDIGLVSVQGASDPRYLGSVSGISFARVVFAAVKSITTTTTGAGSKRGSVSGNASNSTDSNTHPEVGDTAMRDSFFGLATNRKKVRPAKWPSRQLANKLVGLYFDHANPQLPILHKGEFEAMVERVYTLLPERKWQGPRYQKTHTSQGEDDNGRRKTVGERELYMMYIVFGIGAGIFLETDSASSTSGASDDDRDARRNGGRFRKTDRSDPRNSATNSNDPLSPPSSKRLKRDRFDVKQEPPAEEEDYEMIDVEKEDDFEVEERQYSPEEYHAAALPHLEAFLSSESKGGTEELQAVLLLAGYALLRPVAPGLWYIVGVAMRMAVDLGLHFEDNTLEGMNIDGKEDDDKTKGRKEWHREMRRRLWWSVYSLDRLVSTCVGRPIGIQDEVISTRFPSLLPDEYITPHGFKPKELSMQKTYKFITHHYIRLRLLQSEILQVLQQQQSTSPGQSKEYPSYHPYNLKSPYLRNFRTLRDWHMDVKERLDDWFHCAPKSKEETGVEFALEFLELNYWQTVLMLYRPCLKVPIFAKGEGGGKGMTESSGKGMVDVSGKGVGIGSLRTNGKRGCMDGGVLWGGGLAEEERIHWVVADAGRKVLRLYRSLHRVQQVNYTFLATHHLFMSGISFLYAVWHSPLVRSRLTPDDIDLTIMAATSVLDDLVVKCPPAQACKEAFVRMGQATMVKVGEESRATVVSRSISTSRPGWNSATEPSQAMGCHRSDRATEQRTGIHDNSDRKAASIDSRHMVYMNQARKDGSSQILGQGSQQQRTLGFEGQQQRKRILTRNSDPGHTGQQPFPQTHDWHTARNQESRSQRKDPVFDMDLNGLLGPSIQMTQSNVRSQVDSRRRSNPQPQPHSTYTNINIQSTSQGYSSSQEAYFPSSIEEKNPRLQRQQDQRSQIRDDTSDITIAESPELYSRRIGESSMTARLTMDETPEETLIDPDLHFQNFSTGLSPEMVNTTSPALYPGMSFEGGVGGMSSGFSIPGMNISDIDGLLGTFDNSTDDAFGPTEYLGGFF